MDGSFIDIWYSLKLKDRYSYHWEHRAINAEKNVIASNISDIPEEALRDFLSFVQKIMERGIRIK